MYNFTFLLVYLLNIRVQFLLTSAHDLLNKGVVVQLFRVHHMAVHNAALGQGLPDGDGVQHDINAGSALVNKNWTRMFSN